MRERFRFVLLLFVIALINPGASANVVSSLDFEVVPQPLVGRLEQCQDRVIRDQAEWAQLWGAQFPGYPVPVIDFERKMVVLTAMGETISNGASIHVTRVTLRRVAHLTQPLVTVYIRETRPKATCLGTGDGSAPFEAIVLDNYLEVTFRRTSTYVSCT